MPGKRERGSERESVRESEIVILREKWKQKQQKEKSQFILVA